MQKRLAIGRRVKILDQKNREGFNEDPPPPASLRVKFWHANSFGLANYFP